jgi:hypothetical protein
MSARLPCACLVACAALAGPRTADAAQRDPWQEPRAALGVWVGGLLFEPVDDPDTGTWFLSDQVALGGELGVRVADGAHLTLDLGYTRTPYDRLGAAVLGSGDADVLTTHAGIRYQVFRGPGVAYSPFGFVGLGAIHYRLSELRDFDTDFAVGSGAGLDIRLGGSLRLQLGIYQFLAFHQRPGGRGRANVSRQTALRAGLRWRL